MARGQYRVLHMEGLTFHVQATLDTLTTEMLKYVRGMIYSGLEANTEETAVL